MRKGLVIKSISGEYTVYDNNECIVCKPRGLFRHNDMTIKVGDKVEYDEINRIITSVEKRINDLNRPVISNVTKGIIVTSVKDPDLNLNLLDKMICSLEYNKITPVLLFTKIDLLSGDELSKFEEVCLYYKKIGYEVVCSSEESSESKIVSLIGFDICVLLGQSGVGKSTFLNKIDNSLSLKTDVISKALGRGKHTTRHIELFRIGNGFLADSPGFGNLLLDDITLLGLSHSFIEFYENSKECFYHPCYHLNEPKCEVKRKVEEGSILRSRYENYLQFVNEFKNKR